MHLHSVQVNEQMSHWPGFSKDANVGKIYVLITQPTWRTVLIRLDKFSLLSGSYLSLSLHLLSGMLFEVNVYTLSLKEKNKM